MRPALPPFTLNELLTAALKFGLGGVLALFLVYQLAFRFERQLEAVDAKLSAVQTHLSEQASDQRALRDLLFRICLNTAPTTREAQACQAVEAK